MIDSIRLDGRVAIVTGAAGAIGSASAKLLALRGAAIVAIDRPGTDFGPLAEAIGAAFVAVEADVTDEDAVKAFVETTLAHFGRIDILFNNAGIEGPIQRLADYDLDDFRRVMAVNVEGVFLGMKHVLPHMVARGSGSVINTSSISGVCGGQGLVAYNASKHAVIGLTRVAATEVARKGVRVNCINPGPVEGRMIDALDEGGRIDPAQRAALIPARRYALPEEIAGVVAFLASDDSRYINASVHMIDGGLHAIA